jgi:hypothetical protein
MHQQSLTIRLALGNTRGLPQSILSFAEIALHEGNLALAENLYADGLARAARIGDKRAMVQALEGFALLAAANREPDRTLILAVATGCLRIKLGESVTSERERLQEHIVLARQALGEPASQLGITRGRELGLDAAVAFALRNEADDTRSLVRSGVHLSAARGG